MYYLDFYSYEYFDTFAETCNFIKSEIERKIKEAQDEKYYFDIIFDDGTEISEGNTIKEMQNNLHVLAAGYKAAEKAGNDRVHFKFNNVLANKLEGRTRPEIYEVIEILEEILNNIKKKEDRRKKFIEQLEGKYNSMTMTVKDVREFLHEYGGTYYDEEDNESYFNYTIMEVNTAAQLKQLIKLKTGFAYRNGYAADYDDF